MLKEKSPYPKIDKLRKKFDADKPLSIGEACFILWAQECVCSTQYFMFAYWIKQNKLSKTKLRWSLWSGLFRSFLDSDYLVMNKNFELTVKINGLGQAGKLT